jgi:hypothetical protein
VSERLEPAANRGDHIGVHPGGTLVYVLMSRRDEFDMLAAPVTDHGENETGHVLSKNVEGGGIYVVFQYWLKQRTIEAIAADNAARKAGGAQP